MAVGTSGWRVIFRSICQLSLPKWFHDYCEKTTSAWELELVESAGSLELEM